LRSLPVQTMAQSHRCHRRASLKHAHTGRARFGVLPACMHACMRAHAKTAPGNDSAPKAMRLGTAIPGGMLGLSRCGRVPSRGRGRPHARPHQARPRPLSHGMRRRPRRPAYPWQRSPWRRLRIVQQDITEFHVTFDTKFSNFVRRTSREGGSL
jgi:hypothetical protein